MTTSESEVAGTLCRNCRHPLRPGARKCTECNSFQDWHRFLGLSSSVLGLLVALVSVLTFALPIWEETLDEKVMAPKFVMLDVAGDGTTTFSISNAGDAPAALQMIGISRGDHVVTFDLAAADADDALLEPGEIQVTRLSLETDPADEISLEPLLRMFRGKEPCQMQAVFIDAEGDRSLVDVAIPDNGFVYDENELRGQCRFEIWGTVVGTLSRLQNEDAYQLPMCRISRRIRTERGEEPITPHCAEVFRNAGEAGS